MVNTNQQNVRAPAAEEQILVAEKNGVAVVTLNRPGKFNTISSVMIKKLIDTYKIMEDNAFINMMILKGEGRVFCAGGDLNVFVDGKSDEGYKMPMYRLYWFLYHLSTFKKPVIGLLHGLVMGSGAGLIVFNQFRVATEKTMFAMPEVAIGFHTDCGASHWLSNLPGAIGEYMALIGARLNGAEMYTSGLATHYVPVQKLAQLEQRLLELQSGDPDEIDAVIREFSVPAKIGSNSILNKEREAVINITFSKPSVEEILAALETEVKKPGQEWVKEPLKKMKISSPTALKLILHSIRTGRNETLKEALRREWRLTVNSLRAIITDDVYEGIRAIVIDKDNAPKWKPAALEDVVAEDNFDKMVNTFMEEEDLRLPQEGKIPRWGGSWEDLDAELQKLIQSGQVYYRTDRHSRL